MRGTDYADLTIETFPTPGSLPSDVPIDAAGLFGTPSWWHVVLEHAMPAGAEAAFVAVRSAGRIVLVVPLLRQGRQLGSLTTPYSCAYRPWVSGDLDEPAKIAVMAAFARFVRPAGIVRLDALPADWDGLPALTSGARSGGLVPLRFNHFGNWYEDVGGLNWSAYLSRRQGALRETIRRRLRRAEQLPAARFDLFIGSEQIEQAADVFEAVYRRSWKEPEPYASFNVALMRATAASDQLRLGVWSIGVAAVAVQFWVVACGEAIVLKLAHDEAFKAHSPGTVLTAMMLRHLLDNERVVRIDFGRGDDPYKRGWATQRRQRIGLLLVNPWSLRGFTALLRHAAGRLTRQR